jgi:hypothetical protein
MRLTSFPPGVNLIAAMPNQQLYLPGKAEIPIEI